MRLRQSLRVLSGSIWLAVPLIAVLIFGRSLLPEAPPAADAAVADQERDVETPSAAANPEASAESATVALLNDWVYTDEGDETADEKSPTDPGEDEGDQSSDEKPKQGGDSDDQSSSEKPKRT